MRGGCRSRQTVGFWIGLIFSFMILFGTGGIGRIHAEAAETAAVENAVTETAVAVTAVTETAVKRTGWVALNGKVYYLDSTGRVSKGWKKIGKQV